MLTEMIEPNPAIIMKKPIARFLAILFAVFILPSTWANARTIVANSPEYIDVKNAVDSADRGDIVAVPSGTAVWTNMLTLSKNVSLIGAGIGSTIITNGIVSSDSYLLDACLIKYRPASYDADYPMRISGFEFDVNGRRGLILGNNLQAPFVLQTQLRIDHNKFITSTNKWTKGQAIWNNGSLYGVVDNNLFINFYYPIAHSGGSRTWWDHSPQNIFIHGSSYYMYWEDNYFELVGDADNTLSDGEYSGRYVFRYNRIVNSRPTYSLFDLHGEQSTMAACFGAELYGNEVICGEKDLVFLKQRAGQTLVFLNGAVTTRGPQNTAYTSTVCICPTNHVAEKVTHNSYWWGNRINGTGNLWSAKATGGLNCNGIESIPMLGRDIFADASTPGVTSGPLADLPATCVVGQGYWATDQRTSDLTGMVGTNPVTPISGTLYRAVGTNLWEPYYRPYTYPHPLRNGSAPRTRPAPLILEP
jgi:hypothetical protein